MWGQARLIWASLEPLCSPSAWLASSLERSLQCTAASSPECNTASSFVITKQQLQHRSDSDCAKCQDSGKKRAHKLKKNLRGTGRVSLGHPAGQTGVYRPVSQGLPVIYYKKNGQKRAFLPGHRPGVPGTPGHPGGFQKIYVIFSYVPFLLPKDFSAIAIVCARTPPECVDERQITHLICARLKYDLYDFFRGCFWAFYTRERKEAGPKHPLKKSYRSYFRRGTD